MPAARSKEPCGDTPTAVDSAHTVTKAWRGIEAHSVLGHPPPVKPPNGEPRTPGRARLPAGGAGLRRALVPGSAR
jgi:hypothetical protein